MAMADINRFSHVVMDGSPVNAPLGMQGVALRAFGHELRATKVRAAEPGRSLPLLPPAELPDDMQWARPNPRVADAVARMAAAVEREGAKVIPQRVRDRINAELRAWRGEQMPLNGSWIDAAIDGLDGQDRAIARLAIVTAKPQTTRSRILGILSRPGAQLLLLDTPGFHASEKALCNE